MKRTDNTQLPNKDELVKILETEVSLPLLGSKQSIHYPEFSTFLAILEYLNLSGYLFTQNDFEIHQVVDDGRKLLDTMVTQILLDYFDSGLIQLLEEAYDYLSKEDLPKKSDLIFVFGAKTELRIQKAIELYRHGFGQKIMVSGKSPIYYNDHEYSEAERDKNIAIKAGVLESSIIVESQAITIPDNVRRSILQLEYLQIEPKSILLVNSPYTQRRGWAIFKKHLPDSVDLYRINSKTSEQFSKDNWYKQENSLRVVLNEFIKMRASVVYNTA